MSFRHEDYPCCGCGPEGCIDTTRSVRCKTCRRTYHPDPNTGVFCYRCLPPDPREDPDAYYDWLEAQDDRDLDEAADYEED